MSKTYRLKVRRIPLSEDVVYKRPNFHPFKELHMDLLENKVKLKKNPPKPIFVYNHPSPHKNYESFSPEPVDDEDFTLEELEKAYRNNDSDVENVFDDHDDHDSHEEEDHHHDEKRDGEYQQEYFEHQEEEEIDEEERERNDKADLLFKFMVLKRQYPNVDIPEFTEHSDMSTMRRVYDQVIRRVSLDSSVEDYKTYLIGGMMVLEWVSTNWLGIDLQGFTAAQSKSNKYERLLIELGEKNYSTVGSRFPVEVRLLFLIIFNAGLFYVQKMIFSGGGGATVMNALFGGMNQPQNNAPPPKQRKRGGGMRGPTITPDEVEDLTRNRDLDSDDDTDHDKED